MDLYLKEWKHQQHHESDSDQQQPQPLPLFSSQPTTHQQPFSSSMVSNGSYLSMGQREELEVQALIYKHVMAGASIPPQLQLLFNKTLTNNSSPYNYLQHYYYQYPSLVQSGGGYWGRGGMDPEPGRCRRTDGKKWRCAKDVVSGHKYCERHVHRGRNRSRKPVETTTQTATLPPPHAGVALKANNDVTIAAHSFGATHFASSFDLHHNNHRSSESIYENKGITGTTKNDISDNSKSGDRILRHFFDDWPKSGEEHNNTCSVIDPDFSLKLSTGGEEGEANLHLERERPHVDWRSTWDTNHVGSMGGGPLAEALRSSLSTSNSSPTSILLQQLERGSVSETSFVTT